MENFEKYHNLAIDSRGSINVTWSPEAFEKLTNHEIDVASKAGGSSNIGRKLSAGTCSATWCWPAWSVSKRCRKTVKMLIPFRVWICAFLVYLENGPADRGTGEIRTRCAISLSKNFGLRLLLLLDGVLPSFKHHLRHLARRSRAIAGPSLFQQFHQFIVDLYNK